MRELNSIYPDEEDLADAFNREMSTLQESINNLNDLFRRLINANTYVDEDGVSAILHCKKTEIPQALPRYRASRRSYLYNLKEIRDFIEERRIPKRKEK